MNLILIAVKAFSLIAVAFAAFLALAISVGADLSEGRASKVKCTPATPAACLFMIV